MGPRTGAPDETTCITCHSGVANSGSGSAWITAPSEYVAQETLSVFVSVANQGMSRWGFEVTALDGAGQRAGTLIRSDVTHTQLATESSTGRQYVLQNSAGTYNGTLNASPGWNFRWVPPAQGTGPVTFYLAGLAANASGNTLGDSTYTASTTLSEQIVVGVSDDSHTQLPGDFGLVRAVPNPFNPSTSIEYVLSHSANVRITVFNSMGRAVRVLAQGIQTAGRQSLAWDASDTQGRPLPAGVYFCRLETDAHSEVVKMLLLK